MSKAANHKKLRRPKWVPKWLSAPLVIFVAFIVGLLFFNGGNNYLKINEYNRQINLLKAETKANEDSAAIYDAKIQELHTNRAKLERISREKYGMKRESEDVYITDIP